MTKILQCQIGTDELNHGNEKFVVDNRTWRVRVPDHIANFMLADGRAGVYQIPDAVRVKLDECPKCGAIMVKGSAPCADAETETQTEKETPAWPLP